MTSHCQQRLMSIGLWSFHHSFTVVKHGPLTGNKSRCLMPSIFESFDPFATSRGRTKSQMLRFCPDARLAGLKLSCSSLSYDGLGMLYEWKIIDYQRSCSTASWQMPNVQEVVLYSGTRTNSKRTSPSSRFQSLIGSRLPFSAQIGELSATNMSPDLKMKGLKR